MDFEKEDLIIPIFILVALTFVWVTGTPSIESTTVEEIYTFDLTSQEIWSDAYSKQGIICTSDTRIKDMEMPWSGWDGQRWDEIQFEAVEGLLSPVGPGKCAVVRQVEKTKVELYGFEVVL